MEDIDYQWDIKKINCTPLDFKLKINNDNVSNMVMGIQLNIRNLNRSFDQLKMLLKDIEMEMDFVGLSETWNSKDNPVGGNHYLENYIHVMSSTKFNRNGGVSIFVNKKNEVRILDEGEKDIGADYVIVELRGASQKTSYVVIMLYRNPGRNERKFIENISQLLSKEYYKKRNTIIIGDWNIDYSRESVILQDLKDNMHELGFEQMIMDWTRIQGESKTIIDLCFVNDPESVKEAGVIQTGITDHLAIYVGIQRRENQEERKIRLIEQKKNKGKTTVKINRMKLKEDIGECDWNQIMRIETADGAMEALQNTLKYLIDKNKKLIEIKNHYSITKEKWITKELVKKIRKRDRLINKKNKEKDEIRIKKMVLEIKRRNKTIKDEIIVLKNNYYKSKLLKDQRNMKKQWETINDITGRKRKINSLKNIGEDKIIFEGNLSQNNRESANAINRFYIDIAKQKNIDIKRAIKDLKIYDNSIYIYPTTATEIIATINSMPRDKATGEDRIDFQTIFDNKEILANVLANILNKIISEGTFPKTLKKAIIIPIHKKGNRQDPANYRPVSILNSIAKIFEKILHSRLYNFIVTKNKAISNKQFAFRKNWSTEDALRVMTDDINIALEKKEIVVALYLDIEKAFDTVNHELLTKKMENYGVRGLALKLFKSYLIDRKQVVKFQNTLSDEMEVIAGVPQGSCLGPLLFIIYINDMIESMKAKETIVYADDTVVYEIGNEIRREILKIQEVIKRAERWFRINGMSINEKKSVLIVYVSENSKQMKEVDNVTVLINGKQIKISSEVKYLGVTMDRHLRWERQINEVRNKMSRQLPALRRLKEKMTENVMKTIYHSIVESSFIYAIEIWGKANRTRIQKILKMQNRAIRIVYGRNRDENIEDLIKDKKILNVYAVITDKLIKHAGNILNQEEKPGGRIKLTEKEPRTGMATRSEGSIQLSTGRSKTNWGERGSENKMVKIMNWMEQEIELLTEIQRKNILPRKKIKKTLLECNCKKLKELFW